MLIVDKLQQERISERQNLESTAYAGPKKTKFVSGKKKERRKKKVVRKICNPLNYIGPWRPLYPDLNCRNICDFSIIKVEKNTPFSKYAINNMREYIHLFLCASIILHLSQPTVDLNKRNHVKNLLISSRARTYLFSFPRRIRSQARRPLITKYSSKNIKLIILHSLLHFWVLRDIIKLVHFG